MELKDKLKQLRNDRKLTQEAVADYLGISAQTVSKWERGLLSPDISLLPKLSYLYRCSIDSMLGVDAAYSAERRQEFEEKLLTLHQEQDAEGIYRHWMREIERNPDQFSNYPDVMLHVLRNRLYDDSHVKTMLSLAKHAETHCTDHDILHEIYRVMLQICAASASPKIKAQAKLYYQKMPLLRHSREIYACHVMSREEYHAQIKKNLIYTIDLTECAIRQLITPDMPPEEKIFYYRKAISVYESVLDEKYAGFYDGQLLYDYVQIAQLYTETGDMAKAQDAVNRILSILQRHITPSEQQPSKLLYTTYMPHAIPIQQRGMSTLNYMISSPAFASFGEKLQAMLQRYRAYFSQPEDKL